VRFVGIQYACERSEIRTKFGSENLKEKVHFECLGMSRRIILKWILKEIGSEDAAKIYQAQDRDQSQAALNVVNTPTFKDGAEFLDTPSSY
jgi:hypothetical protein